MNDKPIFVVGFQRSGTTLLQALMGAHPRIAAPPEMYFVFRIANFAGRYGDLRDVANLRRVIRDALNPPLDTFSQAGFDEERVLERAREGEPTMRGVFEAIMTDFAERHGKRRWSEKSPGQSIAQVERLFPDAQLLHIVRDPRDVIASSLETPWTSDDAHGLAHRWRNFTLDNIRRGLKAGPARYFQLRYEDLTREPEAVLRVVFAFLGEQYDPEILSDLDRRRPTVAAVVAPWQRRALESITPVELDAWRKRLSRRDQLIIQSVVNGELRALGYTVAPRRMVLVGKLVDQPVRALHALKRWRAARALRDPSAFEDAVRNHLEAKAEIVERHSARQETTDKASG